MSERLAMYLLGPPRLELDRAAVVIDRRKTLALLAYLAVNRWQHHRDHISALMWPGYAQPKAFSNLRHILWEVQQIIGEGWIIASRDTVGLIAEGAGQPNGRVIWLDVARFESLVTASRLQKDASLRVQLLADSVRLYRDHFLAGFVLKNSPPFNEWAFAQSDNWRYQLAGALTVLTDDYCSLGEAETAIPYAKRLVALDPLNEASHRQLMQIYMQAGQQTAALKQYQTCEQILRKELGVDPQPETRLLYKQIRRGDTLPLRPVKRAEPRITPQHNIPFQISRFIGREKELHEVHGLIADHRFVTLVGTGGIGKTRLALRVGEQLVQNYSSGVWLVELAQLSDPSLVPQSVAKLFDLVERADEPLTEKLIRVLRLKSMLLILDNCEHLVDACAQLTDTLLRNCPNLRILATSREPLGITGEARYHVPPLELPSLQQILEKPLDYESIRLFEERARLVQEYFSLTMENASSVTRICHRLDGIPLAIELAAARVDAFSTEQIAAQLEESFNLLTRGSRTALPRHQSLRASIDWSWNLLSESEQVLLRRLSIFAGGWILDAAESVCAGNGIEPKQVLDVMTQLVAKSLVVNQKAGHERRYHLLEIIREYVLEELVKAGEKERVQDLHLKYFLKLSTEIEPGLVGPQQAKWSIRTNNERDNLRAALGHAARTDVEAGLYISGRLEYFWESFDSREGLRWLAEFLQKPESKEHPLARAKALYAQGWVLYRFEQFEAAQSAAEECLALCRAGGDQHGEVDGLTLLGFILGPAKSTDLIQQAITLARSLGDPRRQAMALNILGWDHRDFKRVFSYWEEATTLYRQAGDWRHLADNLSELGFFLLLDGKIEAAQKYLDESNMLFQHLNSKTRKGHLLTAYGQIALLRGDYEQARAYFQENARISIESGSQMDYLWANVRLGLVKLREGNISEAWHVFAESARNFQTDGNSIGIVVSLEWMASLYVAIDKPNYAATLLGWADTARNVICDTRPVLEQVDLDRDITVIVEKIGKDAFEAAYAKGCGMTLDEAVAYALDAG
jgi:predicted ATPase/DNA-binding SARP family transcriptional activator